MNTTNIWIGKCPLHGPVRIEQKIKPTTCHQRIPVGKFNTRICRQDLTDVRSTKGVNP